MSWVEAVRGLKERLEASSATLRHGIAWIPASTLAAQYYCEQKVEMEYRVGRIETESKIEGEALHKALLKMRKTTFDAIIRGIQTKTVYVASLPLAADLDGIPLVGKPDAVVFLRGCPAFVLELKTTRGDPSKLWRDQAAQVKVYGLLLDLMKFDCSQLKLVVPRLKRDGLGREVRKKEFLPRIVVALIKNSHAELEAQYRGSLRVHVLKYDGQEARNLVTWAQDYWLQRREATPTKNLLKCKACEFGKACPACLSEAQA